MIEKQTDQAHSLAIDHLKALGTIDRLKQQLEAERAKVGA